MNATPIIIGTILVFILVYRYYYGFVMARLAIFKDDMITSLLGYVYKLIRSQNLEDPRIKKKLNSFVIHKNLYVRNITQKVLENAK